MQDLNMEMINLYYLNGDILLYKVNDWLSIRRTYKIIGDIIGNNNNIPSLPLKLLPEEALLLMEKNVAKVKIFTEENRRNLKEFQEYETQLLNAEIVEYKKQRKLQLESMIDNIVEKRRQQNDMRSLEEILKEELDKSVTITKSNMLWPILLCPETCSANEVQLSSTDILKLTTELKTKVYRDLSEKGYYITNGTKFGGDFLVYFGDPICHHAVFIIKCVQILQQITPSEIVAFGRLGTAVKKKSVLASIVNDTVSYITISWIDA